MKNFGRADQEDGSFFKTVFVHHINYDSGRYLVAVASAVVLHTGSRSIWAKLSGVWNQCFGIELCFGEYKKMWLSL